MSDTQFTPGPWSMAEPPYDSIPWHHVYGPDGRHIMHRDRSDEEKIASARLIASAPDLYEALRMCLLNGNLDEQERERGEAALARARGQS